jgi:hypothetical protein
MTITDDTKIPATQKIPDLVRREQQRILSHIRDDLALQYYHAMERGNDAAVKIWGSAIFEALGQLSRLVAEENWLPLLRDKLGWDADTVRMFNTYGMFRFMDEPRRDN